MKKTNSLTVLRNKSIMSIQMVRMFLAINLKLNQVLFAFKFEVGDFGCFDVHLMCKHSNYKHQLECNSYSLIDL